MTLTPSRLAACAVIALSGWMGSATAQMSTLDQDIAALQKEWAVIQYQTPASNQEKQFEALASRAHQVTARFPDRAEPHVWEGIVVSSWAGAKGGLGALTLVKQARIEYETAMQIDPKVLDGSAMNSLGVLYYKVPGWPLGFGDNAKAEALLKDALAINPNGADPNYFYADFLVSRKRYAEAGPFIDRALAAPPRPGRDVADAGRKMDAERLRDRIKQEGG